MNKLRIVGIGGGTGLPVLLEGLLKVPGAEVSAIVTSNQDWLARQSLKIEREPGVPHGVEGLRPVPSKLVTPHASGTAPNCTLVS